MEKNGSALAEFARSWHVVLVAMFGVAVGVQGLPTYTFGVLVDSLSEETGWSLSTVTSWSTIFLAATIVGTPLIGFLADRIGARRVILICAPVFALCLLSVPFFIGSLIAFYVAATLYGLVGHGAGYLVYGRAINGWFDAGRGKALGLMLFGGGLSAMFGPPLMRAIIDNYDWRTGYYFLVAMVFVSLPFVFFWLKERRDTEAKSQEAESGVALAQSLRSLVFWLIVTIAFLIILCSTTTIFLLVPFLTGNGVGKADAAWYAGLLGLSATLGRLFFGFVIDRMHVCLAAAGIMLAESFGFLSFAALGVSYPAIAIFIIGLAIGGEIDFVSYAIARYFGMRHYSALTGIVIGIGGLGGVIGPLAFARLMETTGSYGLSFTGAATACGMATMLLLILWRFPFFRNQ